MLTVTSARPHLDGDHRYWSGERELLGATRMLTDAGYIDRRWFTDEACLRGAYVHEAVWLDLRGDLDEEALDERLLGYVHAARAFRRDAAVRVALAEEPLADLVLGIAGKPDVAGYAFARPAVVDWKSGDPYRWHRLQGEIYKHLVRVNQVLPEPVIDAYSVYLHDDGRYTLGERSTLQDRAVVQALITIANDKRAA